MIKMKQSNQIEPFTSKEQPFGKYFDSNIWIFKVCGLWIPLKTETAFKKAYYYTKTFLIFFYLSLYQPAETGVMFIAPDLDTFLRSLRDQFNHFSCIFKITVWLRNRKMILHVIDTLKDPIYNYYNYEKFFDVDQIIAKNKKEADRWMYLFLGFVNSICFNMTLLICYVFIFEAEQQYKIDENGKRVYAQQLAVNLLSPFNQLTRVGFMLHFVFEIIALDIHAWMIVGLDSLFTTVVSCICAHLDILREAFRTIRPRCLERLNRPIEENLHDSPELQEEMQREMKKCVVHLDMILDVSSKIETIYNLQTCVQVLISLFEMCFCLYLLSGNLDQSMGAELTFLVSTSFELLLYCWFGNSITESSDALTTSIFQSDWLSSNSGFKKSMLITMIRIQKPICMTIGKFTPLTFTTFLSMARIAYSFFTVLKSDAFD